MTVRVRVRVREATGADAAGVATVFLAARAATMAYLPRLHSDQDTRAWFADVVLVQRAVWVAQDEATDRVVGLAALLGSELEHLYVHPDLARQGIGTRLLGAARRASPDELTLHVFQRNDAARSFYAAHGFELVHLGDGEGNEENEPDATYRWVRPVALAPAGGPTTP